MQLDCVECHTTHNIPDDKWDDYNIYLVWDGVGSAVTASVRLLCRKCTDKFIERGENEPRTTEN